MFFAQDLTKNLINYTKNYKKISDDMRFIASTVWGFMLKENSSKWNNPVAAQSNVFNNVNMKSKQQTRFMVGRANNRSGVHGTHLPVTHTLDNEEEIQEEINKGKKDKEEKRKHVEQTVDSHLKRSDQHPKSTTK